MQPETRFLPGTLEIRAAGDKGLILAGVAMKYGARAQIGRFSARNSGQAASSRRRTACY